MSLDFLHKFGNIHCFGLTFSGVTASVDRDKPTFPKMIWMTVLVVFRLSFLPSLFEGIRVIIIGRSKILVAIIRNNTIVALLELYSVTRRVSNGRTLRRWGDIYIRISCISHKSLLVKVQEAIRAEHFTFWGVPAIGIFVDVLD